jgi:hypothetical protein
MEQGYQFAVGQVRYLGIELGVLEVQVDRRTMRLVLKWDLEGGKLSMGLSYCN